MLFEGSGRVGRHESIIGRSVTFSDLYFRTITLVSLWRKDLGEGKIPNWEVRRSF